MSIFISIASYRDPELIRTIKSAIDNAAKPDELYFGIVIQDFERDIPNLSWIKNLSLVTMHPRDARGAGYARSIAMQAYKNQDYYLQIDSHTIFEKHWDMTCIDQLHKAQEISKNKKIILSHFPPAFHVESNNMISYITKDKDKPPYATKQVPKLNKRNEWTAERIELSDRKRSLPETSSTVLAGFVFTLGSIVEEVPYDPEISFFGEEICFAMRAWTRGWDIYSPNVVIIHHFYHRGNYSKIWKDRNIRKISWKELEQLSKEKQKRVLCGIEKGPFGAGKYRHIRAYEKLIGFDFKKMYGLTNSDNDSTIVLSEKR
jgi:hypothetical protein